MAVAGKHIRLTPSVHTLNPNAPIHKHSEGCKLRRGKNSKDEVYIITKTTESRDENNPYTVDVVFTTKNKRAARSKLHNLKSTPRASWQPRRMYELHPATIT